MKCFAIRLLVRLFRTEIRCLIRYSILRNVLLFARLFALLGLRLIS